MGGRAQKQKRRQNDSEISYWSELFESTTEIKKRQREEDEEKEVEEEEKPYKAGRDEKFVSRSRTGK